MSDPIMNFIHVIIDGLVHALDPIRNVDLTIKQLCLIDAGHFFNLFNQRTGFLVCNKF
ncbi:hypothetical protein SDC9_168873 [bioreactor metagenome]|uniref:Uncharacterized protein n=1 Tax=bioreactor metagenome TaxID=1076179 RepID=A0A645GCA2_9ZZZZ